MRSEYFAVGQRWRLQSRMVTIIGKYHGDYPDKDGWVAKYDGVDRSTTRLYPEDARRGRCVFVADSRADAREERGGGSA